MTVAAAQHEVRSVFLSGSPGQAVSAGIWAASALAATLGNPRAAILTLVLGGTLILPLTQAVLRLMGRPIGLGRDNPLNGLGMQVAFIVPLTLPVAGAAALHHLNWFYPAVMVVVGAHYLPFVFLYGMRSFGVLAAALVAGGLGLGLWARDSFVLGGWMTAAALLAFAAWAAVSHRNAAALGARPVSA